MKQLITSFALLAMVSPTFAAGWGHIEGQFVLDGAVPEVPPLVKKGDATVKDAEVCAAEAVPNDGMLFDKETGGIANVVIYMRKAPSVHPDLKAPAEKEVVFDQKNCRFIPNTLVIHNKQTVVCKNSDGASHNVHTNPFVNTPANFLVSANDTKGVEVKMPVPESLPVKVVCDIHPWMLGWWVVVDHPYAAVTDAQGKFKIENLPEGEMEFRVWHPKTGYIDRKWKVTVKDGETTTVKPVKVSLSDFKD